MTIDHAFQVEHDHADPLLAEHALGTVDPHDRDRIDAHLAACAACRTTFAELASGVAALERDLGDVTVRPRAGARESLLAAARSTPQHSVIGDAGARRAARRAPRRWRTPSWLAAGAASLACLALAAVLVDRQDRIASLERRLADAKGDQVAVLRGASVDDLDIGGPFGDSRAQVVLKRDAGIVALRDVPAPPDGMAWQLWTIDADERIRSLGVLESARDLAFLSIEGMDPVDVERIIVTTEPVGGSDEPTADEVAGATV